MKKWHEGEKSLRGFQTADLEWNGQTKVLACCTTRTLIIFGWLKSEISQWFLTYLDIALGMFAWFWLSINTERWSMLWKFFRGSGGGLLSGWHKRPLAIGMVKGGGGSSHWDAWPAGVVYVQLGLKTQIGRRGILWHPRVVILNMVWIWFHQL